MKKSNDASDSHFSKNQNNTSNPVFLLDTSNGASWVLPDFSIVIAITIVLIVIAITIFVITIFVVKVIAKSGIAGVAYIEESLR